jgi:C4-dicarboxylate-specific signal transduction histidine kinase
MRDALLMGRLTASATHEIQNILATIRESSGLMEDLLAMSSEGFAHAERFKKGLRVLAEQVERGMVLTEQLNYCAHAPEQSPAGAEVNEAMRALIGLSRRHAARRKAVLELTPGRSGLRTSLRAVEIMDAVGAALEAALDVLPMSAQLMLSVEEQGGLAVVRLDSPGFEALRESPAWAGLTAQAKALGIGLAPGSGGMGVVLALPRPQA